jgi:hypothetical protein
MCPVCLATAAWIVAATVSTGGITALAINKVVTRQSQNNFPTVTPSKEDHHV